MARRLSAGPSLILGRGFIARAVAAALPPDEVLLLPHRAVRDGLPERVSAVLWGGRHPALGTADWRLEDELELQAARLAAARGLPFLSLGTRKVYAPSPMPLAEDAALGPVDRYGAQKLALETALGEVLDGRLVRLRLANLFGPERHRATFMGRMLTTLAEAGDIRFDMSPFTRRDFIPVALAGRAIAALLRQPPCGEVVNIGSGVALACGRLALWLIEGAGRGRLVCTGWEERDAFVLDVGRMTAATGVSCGADALRAACLELGHHCRGPLPP